MSATVSVLVEFIDGKPRPVMGPKSVRAYTRPGNAENMRSDELKWTSADRDIRILTVTIPELGPITDGFWPNEFERQIATGWS